MYCFVFHRHVALVRDSVNHKLAVESQTSCQFLQTENMREGSCLYLTFVYMGNLGIISPLEYIFIFSFATY